jgi:hypothetical protein
MSDLKALPLTGNRDMAEDLDRESCAICGRTFAPSVLVRHTPICARNKAAKQQKQTGQNQLDPNQGQ